MLFLFSVWKKCFSISALLGQIVLSFPPNSAFVQFPIGWMLNDLVPAFDWCFDAKIMKSASMFLSTFSALIISVSTRWIGIVEFRFFRFLTMFNPAGSFLLAMIMYFIILLKSVCLNKL